MKAIDIYEQNLVYKYRWGAKKVLIRPAQIILFGETIVEKTKYIHLQLSDRFLLLPVATTDNDIELLHQLTVWNIKRADNIYTQTVTKQSQQRKDILLNLILIAIGVYIIYAAYILQPHYYSSAELVPISGHLSQKPDIHKPRKSGKWVSFTLSQYPHLRFSINKLGYKAMQTIGLPYILPGSSAKLWITKADFHKYIIQDTSLNFTDKHFTLNRISVYGIEIDYTTLLTYKDFNAAKKERNDSEKNWGWLILAGIICILFRKQLKKRFNPWRIKK